MVKMLIAGEHTDATATDELEVVDPATEDIYETVPAGGVDAVELAVHAAAGAFAEWSKTDAEQRAELIRKGLDLVGERKDEVIGTLTHEQGKPTIEAAGGILVAAPVYNYDVAAAAKNMIELTGSAWEDKVVGFLCAAGGTASYMSVMAYANSLMLDFRCVIIPRFVFATSEAFDGENITDKKITERVEKVANDLVRFTKALRS